jgi:hypothetical protein
LVGLGLTVVVFPLGGWHVAEAGVEPAVVVGVDPGHPNATLICLARRRCNVILAMLRTSQPYNPHHRTDLTEAA